ncbi:MAG: HAD family acid phosphatase [Actinomycetota bacterium]
MTLLSRREFLEAAAVAGAAAAVSADVYKSQERDKLQRSGHRIVASIGDQVSDMSLGHLKAGFLLPNVMYYIP